MVKIFTAKTLLLIAALFLTSIVYAQDSIFLENNRIIVAKVVAVRANMISYKKPGSTKTSMPVSMHFVDSIKYENGDVYRVDDIRGEKKQKKVSAKLDRRSRNQYIDPYKNRIIIGASVIDREFLLARAFAVLVGGGNEHTPIMGVFGTIERNVFSNKISVNASSTIGLNRDYYGVAVGGRYHLIRKKTINLSVGPIIGYAYREIEQKRYKNNFVLAMAPYSFLPRAGSNEFVMSSNKNFNNTIQEAASVIVDGNKIPYTSWTRSPIDYTIETTHSNTITTAGNVNIQFGKKRVFMNVDINIGGEKYLKTGLWMGHFATRMGVGYKF